MKSFTTAFFDGVIAIGLLPCWLIGALTWRYSHGKWVWVSPVAYANHAAARRDWLTLVIAIFLWSAPTLLILIFH